MSDPAAAPPDARPTSVRRDMSLADRLRGDDAYGIVLLAIFASLLAAALIGDTRWGRVVVVAMQGATLLFAQWTSHVSRRIVIGSAILILAGAVVASLGDIPDRSQLARVGLVLGALLAAATIVFIGRRIGFHPAVSAETVLGAVCIYLLIGQLFAYVFHVADVFESPFFAQGRQVVTTTLLYYSYSTLATIGFGDFTAATDLGRLLSVLEGLIGQLYLVTVVAVLVANVGRTRPARRNATAKDGGSGEPPARP